MSACKHTISPRLAAELEAAGAEVVGGGEDEDGKFHVVKCAVGHKSSWQTNAEDEWSCPKCSHGTVRNYVVTGGQVHVIHGEKIPDVAWVTSRHS